MEIKEKLLCALRSQADKIKDKSYRGCGEYLTITYLEVDTTSSIALSKINIYDEKLVKKVNIIKPKYFWQKDITEETEVIEYTVNSYKGQLEFSGEKFEITKEEYDEIIELRQQKIKERQIKQLDKLCSTKN